MSQQPAALLKERIELLHNTQCFEELIGSYNTREGTVRTRGTGLRGDVSKALGLVGWSRNPEGIKKLREDAQKAGIGFPLYIATQRNKWATAHTIAKAELEMFEPELLKAQKALKAFDADHKELALLSLDDLQLMLDTYDPAAEGITTSTRLADEAASQTADDLAVAAVASRT